MAKNILGTELTCCCLNPVTGFYRNGKCDTGPDDIGQHTVCAEMTADFLAYSATVGNDLSIPCPEFHFPGVKAGDRWCLCVTRWIQAYEAGVAPKVVLSACHISVLEHVDLDLLKSYAVPDPDL